MTARAPLDRLARPIHDLRVSVTDRCNFRCGYCMPSNVFGPGFRFLPPREILSFEEITRLARIFVSLGARKVRLTGGEPLLRRELHKLVAMLRSVGGLEVTLTTNGSLLASHAEPLARAGLTRLSVSLDSLDDSVFRSMNEVDFAVARVLEGIEAASAAGLGPIKVNAVVRRGKNEHTVIDLVRHFKGTGHILRFIELMDVGTTNGWRLDEVVAGREILERIHSVMPLEPILPAYRGEVAKRYRFRDGSGEIGFITSVTQPFCTDCSRARISSDGRLFTCLFARNGTDLRAALRGGADDDAIAALVRQSWGAREDRYSEQRAQATDPSQRIEMSYIGG